MALGMFCLACCFSGCQSRKIAYGNSYYFKQNPKPVAKAQPQIETPAATPTEPDLRASLEKGTGEKEVVNRLAEARQQLATIVKESNNPELQASVERTKRLAGEMKSEQLTRKEVRAKRKELRQELRILAKEFRNAAPEQTQAIDRNLKLALILLGAALVLSIIAGATAGTGGGFGIIWLLATLSWIAGLVFFVLWLVEDVA